MNRYVAKLYRGVRSQPIVVRTFDHDCETIDEFLQVMKPHNGYNRVTERNGKLFLTSMNFGECFVIDYWEITGVDTLQKKFSTHTEYLRSIGKSESQLRRLIRHAQDDKAFERWRNGLQRSQLVRRAKKPAYSSA